MRRIRNTRLSVSIPADLVPRLDAMVHAKGYANRSQAVADMIRAQIVEHQAQHRDHPIAGTITLVYDHHRPGIQALLTGIQHDHAGLIIANLHVHLDHHNCLEVIAVRGPAAGVRRVADRLIAAKGVKHGRLTMTTTGAEFAR